MIKKGTVIADTYLIKEQLGEGSCGTVFLAGKVNGEELYTLKLSEDKELLKREAFLCGQMQSEYFPGFVDYGEDGAYGYLVLEYVEGISLQHLLDKGRTFSERDVLIVMESITAALSRLHHHRIPIVHLDIKPANVIVTTKGEVRIIDMGAGSPVGVRQGRKGGTYGYGAPEQFWQGILPGPAADVYACGKVMAYLLTGKNPCQPPYDVEKKLLKSKGVKKSWQQVILKCLEQEPQKRYPDGKALHREIMNLQKAQLERGKVRNKQGVDIIYLKSIWKSDYERV
ncbi:MAG: serine/threonine protein kinase [Lachnospiraceae bacterium]|nr:serine/threonine protein kinase [Lachnospiraceae bacterium]